MTTLVEALGRPRERMHPIVADALLIFTGSLVIAGLAQVSISLLPFSPVPVTGQTLAVLLVGAALGPGRGAAAVLLYLAEGAGGLPVFAEFKGGAAYLLFAAPTGGYLWGFVLGAALVGALARRGWDRSPPRCVGAMVVAEVAIFVCGVGWLAQALDVSVARALELGLYPFLVGEVVKILLASGLLPGAWRFVERMR